MSYKNAYTKCGIGWGICTGLVRIILIQISSILVWDILRIKLSHKNKKTEFLEIKFINFTKFKNCV